MSLVELMISVTLSLLLIAGLIKFLVSNKQVETLQSDVQSLQSNARVSLEFMARDIRMADSGACMKLSYWRNFQNLPGSSKVQNHVQNSGANAFLNNLNPISGWEAANTGANDTLIEANALGANRTGVTNNWNAGAEPVDLNNLSLAIPNSDIISVAHASSLNILVENHTENASNELDTLTVSDGTNIKSGDILLMSDCRVLDIFVACKVSGNTIELNDASSSGACAPNSDGTPNLQNEAMRWRPQGVVNISKLVHTTYFVGKPDGATLPGLYQATNGSTAQQMVEGVTSLQILYDGKPISDFSNAVQAESIKQVQIGMLMVSKNTFAGSGKQRNFSVNGLDLTLGGTDQHLRRVYQTSVLLRSRI